MLFFFQKICPFVAFSGYHFSLRPCTPPPLVTAQCPALHGSTAQASAAAAAEEEQETDEGADGGQEIDEAGASAAESNAPAALLLPEEVRYEDPDAAC